MTAQQRTYEPRMRFLATVLAFVVLAKLLPYLLPHLLAPFGITASIRPGETTYPWGFSPVAAVCLFGAVTLRQTRYAYALPLAAWLVSDFALLLLFGLTESWDFGLQMSFYPNQVLTYASLALIVLCGFGLRNLANRMPGCNLGSWAGALRFLPFVLGAGLIGSVAFFLITNFGVWAAWPTYPHTWEGLLACYAAGVPYFRNFAAGTVLFSMVLFSPIGVRALEAAEQEPSSALEPAREHVAVPG